MVTLCKSWFPRHWVTYPPPTWTISFTGVCYWAWSRKLARSREDCRKFGVWQDGKGIVCFKKCMGTSLSPLVFTLYLYEGSISKYGIIKNQIIMDKMAFEWKVCLQYFLTVLQREEGWLSEWADSAASQNTEWGGSGVGVPLLPPTLRVPADLYSHLKMSTVNNPLFYLKCGR